MIMAVILSVAIVCFFSGCGGLTSDLAANKGPIIENTISSAADDAVGWPWYVWMGLGAVVGYVGRGRLRL